MSLLEQPRRKRPARRHTLAALALLLVTAALPGAARAQWTQPDANQNISNTNSGNVGVGTSSPQTKLDVSGGSIQLSNTDFNSVSFRDGDATLRRHALWINNTNAGGGMLGGLTNFPAWGTAGPSPSALYFVAPYDGNWNQWYPTLTLKGTSANGAGNVGVGTTSPAARLHVVGTIRVNFTDTTTWPAIRGEFKQLGDSGGLTILAQGANGTASGSGDINFATSVSNSADGFTDAPTATRMTIKYDGRVGVGTTSPAYKLDVAGAVNAAASGGLCIAGDCRTSWAAVGGGQWSNTASGISYGGGNVGVGTANPTSPLTVVGPAGHTAPALDLQGNGDLKLSPYGVIFFDGNYNYAAGSYIGPYSVTSQSFDANTIKVTTAGVERLRVTGGGNVGIGIAAPASKLHVAGDVTVDGNISAKYQDVAEWVSSTQKLAAGTVVVLDSERANQVVASTEAYDMKVAGVVSESPGVILGTGGEGKLKVATTGRVKVRVDATRAPVRIGDLLVTSDVQGVAMKSEPVVVGGRKIHAPGTIIGKALEPLERGAGEILVLLSLQ